jgi:hypothetical protein
MCRVTRREHAWRLNVQVRASADHLQPISAAPRGREQVNRMSAQPLAYRDASSKQVLIIISSLSGLPVDRAPAPGVDCRVVSIAPPWEWDRNQIDMLRPL